MNSLQSKFDSLPFKRPLLKIHLKVKKKKNKRTFEFPSHILSRPPSEPTPLTLYLYSQIKFSPHPFWVPIIIFIDSLWKTILPPYIFPFSHSVVVDLFEKLRTFIFFPSKLVFIYYFSFFSFYRSLRTFVRSFLSRADK